MRFKVDHVHIHSNISLCSFGEEHFAYQTNPHSAVGRRDKSVPNLYF